MAENEFLNPRNLVLPHYTTAEKEALIVETGTIVWDETLAHISVCITARTAGAAAWEETTQT